MDQVVDGLGQETLVVVGMRGRDVFIPRRTAHYSWVDVARRMAASLILLPSNLRLMRTVEAS